MRKTPRETGATRLSAIVDIEIGSAVGALPFALICSCYETKQMNREEVLETLAYLEKTSPDVFGAKNHGFRLNKPCGEEGVLSFERASKIRLPDDYRKFISLIGNGGAGPDYGIFQLGTMQDQGYNCGTWQQEVGNIAEDFPYSLETSADNEEGGKPNLFVVGPYGYKRRHRGAIAPNEHANLEWHTGAVNGAIPVCHGGCGYFFWLVISGVEAGHLWFDNRAAELGFEPILSESGNSTSFDRWYMDWLEASVRKSHTGSVA